MLGKCQESRSRRSMMTNYIIMGYFFVDICYESTSVPCHPSNLFFAFPLFFSIPSFAFFILSSRVLNSLHPFNVPIFFSSSLFSIFIPFVNIFFSLSLCVLYFLHPFLFSSLFIFIVLQIFFSSLPSLPPFSPWVFQIIFILFSFLISFQRPSVLFNPFLHRLLYSLILSLSGCFKFTSSFSVFFIPLHCCPSSSYLSLP